MSSTHSRRPPVSPNRPPRPSPLSSTAIRTAQARPGSLSSRSADPSTSRRLSPNAASARKSQSPKEGISLSPGTGIRNLGGDPAPRAQRSQSYTRTTVACKPSIRHGSITRSENVAVKPAHRRVPSAPLESDRSRHGILSEGEDLDGLYSSTHGPHHADLMRQYNAVKLASSPEKTPLDHSSLLKRFTKADSAPLSRRGLSRCNDSKAGNPDLGTFANHLMEKYGGNPRLQSSSSEKPEAPVDSDEEFDPVLDSEP